VSQNILKTQDIVHRYSSSLEIAFPDIDVSEAESLLILGKSGVGKTTLLHILSGILSPTQGKVEVDGHQIFELSTTQRDKLRGNTIGVIFQQPHFVVSLTALENLELATSFSSNNVTTNQMLDMMERLQILNKQNSKVNTLSQGQLQRLSIARACLGNPKLLLADEPTSALDDDNAKAVIDLLLQMQSDSDAALIIVTHDQRVRSAIDNTLVLKNTNYVNPITR